MRVLYNSKSEPISLPAKKKERGFKETIKRIIANGIYSVFSTQIETIDLSKKNKIHLYPVTIKTN